MHNSELDRNRAIVNRKESMLRKLKNGKPKPLSEIDVFGSVDSQSIAELINENKVEMVDGKVPTNIGGEIWQISKLMVQLKK